MDKYMHADKSELLVGTLRIFLSSNFVFPRMPRVKTQLSSVCLHSNQASWQFPEIFDFLTPTPLNNVLQK